MMLPPNIAAGRERIRRKYADHETVLRGRNLRIGASSLQLKSCNRKLGHVELQERPGVLWKWTIPHRPFCVSTYTSISATCPVSCSFRDNGCYSQEGPMGVAENRLDAYAREHGVDGLTANEMEADLIDWIWPTGVPQDGARGGRDLRLHVGGDVAGNLGAEFLAAAATRYRARGGGDVWTYTSRWRTVDHDAWGPDISALASVKNPAQAEAATRRGYTPAITLRTLLRSKAYTTGGLTVIPCPAETLGKTCVECRLCFGRSLGNRAIGFQVHGQGAAKAANRLPIIDQETLHWN